MWFKKKREDNDNSSTWARVTSVDDLKKEIEKLQESNKTLNDGFSKLQRIVKYSGSEPTYRLDYEMFFDMFTSPRRKYTLYIYSDKEEYVVELEELNNRDVVDDTASFRVEGNYAYFDISTCFCYVESRKWTRYEFIIDFKNGKYICSRKDDEERNAKEEVKLVIE